MKPSKMVSDRAVIARTVRSSLKIHGPEIAPELEKLLFPQGAPAKLTVGDFVQALGDSLDRYVDALAAADSNHSVELADDDGYRILRDERIAELRNLFSSLRDLVVRNYSLTVAAAYGLTVTLPEDPQQLLTSTRNAVKTLRERPLVEPPRNKSLKLDPNAAADDLEAHAKALEKALDDVERERREAQVTQSAKDALMGRWAVIYPGIADSAAALFTLAGRPELAERVRPTARRRSGVPEEEDTEATTPAPPEPPPAPVETAQV
ncbi:hypothetical protein [Polyangium aurulentum]|uniref:hypothetical protein n=1 Tax=Polyangium aurulentum TaxID=2567896 RepID=UPI0010AE5334|nr:hypothetical protein [Polyangium aurulentum]UQA62623.1 hypothetical protein E8A73_020075 [Polyangium aurulentum]